MQNVRFLNALIASDIVIQKVFAFVKRNMSSAQKITQSLISHAGRNPNQMRVVRRQSTSQLQRLYSLQGITKEFFPYITEKNDNIRIMNWTCKRTN